MVKIVLHDFLNYTLDGLNEKEMRRLKQLTGIVTKGAFMLQAVRNGLSDGKEAFINDDGVGLVYDLPNIIDALYRITTLDMNTAEFEDHRNITTLNLPPIGDDWLEEETGYKLYDYQKEGINKVIMLTHNELVHGGILKLPTNAGKSVITLGISKAFDGFLKTLVLVPSANLVEQTYRDYAKADILTAKITANLSKKRREAAIASHDHIIMTSSLFLNMRELFEDEERVLIYDEVHLFGDKTSEAIRQSLGHCQYRIGLTATMPAEKKDYFKDYFIRCHFGEDLVSLDQRELIDRGISSDIKIDCININTPIDPISFTDEAWEWSTEQSFYDNNAIRFDAILEQVSLESNGNTLILCHPEIGRVMSEVMGKNVVLESVATSRREQWYSEFKEATDYTLFATYGCASTGLSINNIQTLILIEIGKDRTRIMQSIGRGLRLDGVTNFIRVVDISSNTKFARQHRRTRERIYKQEGFEYETIRVVDAE